MKRCRDLSSLVLLSAVAMFCGNINVSLAASAGCFVGPARLDDSAINSFLNAPAELLTANSNGGLELATQIRGLAGSSADTLQKIQSLFAEANPMQKSAIGAGLARAARACQKATPDYSLQIQTLVAGSGVPELIAAFVGALNEVQTASLGGGASGGAAAGGIGNSGAGNGTSGEGSDSPITISTSAQTFSFSSGRSVGSVTDQSVTGGGTTSVSPAG